MDTVIYLRAGTFSLKMIDIPCSEFNKNKVKSIYKTMAILVYQLLKKTGYLCLFFSNIFIHFIFYICMIK